MMRPLRRKTLPVAVTVISYLDEAVWGGHGLIAIPCIVGHVSQLFIDAAIAARWAASPPEAEARGGVGSGDDIGSTVVKVEIDPEETQNKT